MHLSNSSSLFIAITSNMRRSSECKHEGQAGSEGRRCAPSRYQRSTVAVISGQVWPVGGGGGSAVAGWGTWYRELSVGSARQNRHFAARSASPLSIQSVVVVRPKLEPWGNARPGMMYGCGLSWFVLCCEVISEESCWDFLVFVLQVLKKVIFYKLYFEKYYF